MRAGTRDYSPFGEKALVAVDDPPEDLLCRLDLNLRGAPK